MSRILVTGATGAIGGALVRALEQRGDEVRALVREGTPSSFGPRVAVVRGSVEDSQAVRRAVESMAVIYHLAARLHVPDAPESLRPDYQRVNVDGSGNLARAAAQAGVQRFLFFSTISVYGPSQPGRVHDESSPLRPDSLYAETKVEAEEVVRREFPQVVVLRLAAVYGPEMKGNYVRLLRALERRRFALVGDGSNRRTLVHVQDAVRAALVTERHPDTGGRTFNVTDGATPQLRQIVAAMKRALGRSPRIPSIPAGPVLGLAGFLEDLFRLLGRDPPIRRSSVRKLLEDVAVDGHLLQESTGFRPDFDLASGWRDTALKLRGVL